MAVLSMTRWRSFVSASLICLHTWISLSPLLYYVSHAVTALRVRRSRDVYMCFCMHVCLAVNTSLLLQSSSYNSDFVLSANPVLSFYSWLRFWDKTFHTCSNSNPYFCNLSTQTNKCWTCNDNFPNISNYGFCKPDRHWRIDISFTPI